MLYILSYMYNIGGLLVIFIQKNTVAGAEFVAVGAIIFSLALVESSLKELIKKFN